MGALCISACLVGIPCRYDGGTCFCLPAAALAARMGAVIVCAEVAGGLPTPRRPAEIIGGSGADVLDGLARVQDADGADVTEAFLAGALRAVELVERAGVRAAILKEGSPACGVRRIHRGAFDGSLGAGEGVTAALLRRHGIRIFSDEECRDPTFEHTLENAL